MAEFKCEQCGKVFSQEMSLKQHVNDKHMQKPAEERPHAEQHAREIPHHEHKPEQKVKLKIGKSAIYAIVAIVVVAAVGYGAYYYFTSSAGSSSSAASILSAPIGPLGSTHIHADYAIYMDGEKVEFSDAKYFERNRFTHAHQPYHSLIHMHATGITLGFFLKSLGTSLSSECFTLDNGKEFCNDGEKTLKMFVKRDGGEWEESREFHTYMMRDLDKILITYGDETAEEIATQQDSVTDFAIEASRGTISG